MWCLWDTGTSAYNAVMLTFVFTVYLTSPAVGSSEYTSTVLSVAMTVAGFAIALTAPLIGQRSDLRGPAPRSPATPWCSSCARVSRSSPDPIPPSCSWAWGSWPWAAWPRSSPRSVTTPCSPRWPVPSAWVRSPGGAGPPQSRLP